MQESHEHPSTRPPSAPVELESLLGGRGLQAVGLISLFLSAAFFFKLAVDHGWIQPLVRVIIGLVAGTALLGWSVMMRGRPNGNPAIIEGLTALGGALCYLSIWAAGPLFELIDATVALEGMSVVTAVLTFLAARHHSRPTAIYGVIGGLLTPALLPHAGGQIVIGAYVLALCAAMLKLATDRRFRLIPAVAFAGSLLYAPQLAADPVSGWTSLDALILATLFFLEFAIDQFAAARRAGTPDVLDRALNVLNIGAFIGLLELDLRSQDGLLAVTLIALFAGLAALAYNVRGNAAMNALYLWAATAALTLAVPAYFTYHTALMYAAFVIEGTAIYAFGLLRARSAFRAAGFGLAVLAAPIGCIATYGWSLSTGQYIENLATFTAVAFALFGMAAIARANDDVGAIWLITDIPGVVLTLANVVVAAGIAAAIFAIPATFIVSLSQQHLLLSIAWTIHAALLFAIALRRGSRILRWQSLALLAVTIGKVVVVDLASIELIDRVAVCFGLGVVALVVSAFYLRRPHHNAVG
jgi:uncharacterized membrane protein